MLSLKIRNSLSLFLVLIFARDINGHNAAEHVASSNTTSPSKPSAPAHIHEPQFFGTTRSSTNIPDPSLIPALGLTDTRKTIPDEFDIKRVEVIRVGKNREDFLSAPDGFGTAFIAEIEDGFFDLPTRKTL